MIRIRNFLLALITVICCGSLTAQQAPPASLEGQWLGTLQVGGGMRIAFHFDVDGDSVYTTIDIPDQGTNGIPTAYTRYVNGELQVSIPLIRGQYKGKYDSAANTIRGAWIQGAPLALELKKVDVIPPLIRPQDPVKPYPYAVEEVTFQNKSGDSVYLSGTLTIPEGAGPFPAVILISGSGPQDRDESLLGHKPFLVLSDHLTRNGIIVLRYDDRGFGKSTGDFSSATTFDFADDALAAVHYLVSRNDLPVSRIGLAGHSEGGVIAPMVASRSDAVDFLVLLAGTGIPGDSILQLQGRLIGAASGLNEAVLNYSDTLRMHMIHIVKDESDPRMMREKLIRYNKHFIATTPAPILDAMDMTASDTTYAIDFFATKWMHHFLRYDPRPVLEKTTIPVLAMNGTKDLQVPDRENLEAIERALQKAGNTQYRVMRMEGLNHLFQTSVTGSPSEYASIAETFSPKALEAISSWINAR